MASNKPRVPLRPYQRPAIKDPGDDPVIAMARDRREKELKIESTRRLFSGVTGSVLHKELDLKTLESEIKALADGVQEYDDQVVLMQRQKRDYEKKILKHQEWCDVFDQLIGAAPPLLFEPVGRGPGVGAVRSSRRKGRAWLRFAYCVGSSDSARTGPFEAKYEESKAVVKESYDFAKVKYRESLQKLITDFGFHPAFKRWFDEF